MSVCVCLGSFTRSNPPQGCLAALKTKKKQLLAVGCEVGVGLMQQLIKTLSVILFITVLVILDFFFSSSQSASSPISSSRPS